MIAQHVYQLRDYRPGEDCPTIDADSPQTEKTYSWWNIGEIVLGEIPVEQYQPLRLATTGAHAGKWDVFGVPLTFGLFSQAAIDAIGKYMTGYFDLLPAFVDDRKFYLPRLVKQLDCLDRAKSTIEPFRSNPQSIMLIIKYAFFKDRIPDPAVFAIPERRYSMYATDSVKNAAEAAKLQGLYFVDMEVYGDDH